MALAPICLGVALATTGDSDISIAGACWASAGLIAAAGYQVSVKSTQNSLKVRFFSLREMWTLVFCTHNLSYSVGRRRKENILVPNKSREHCCDDPFRMHAFF